jgi:hypothetical protein
VVRYIDVESCGLRFKSEGEPRPVSRIRWEGEECTVSGLSSNGPCAVQQIVVEDSSAGTAVLITGGDLGVRIDPPGIDEPYLLLAASAVLD